MKYRFYASIVHSRPDIYGNRYYFMRVLDNETGNTALGRIDGGEGNCTEGIRKLAQLAGDGCGYNYSVTELKIRDFNQRVKGMPWLGCLSSEIAESIKKQFSQSAKE